MTSMQNHGALYTGLIEMGESPLYIVNPPTRSDKRYLFQRAPFQAIRLRWLESETVSVLVSL